MKCPKCQLVIAALSDLVDSKCPRCNVKLRIPNKAETIEPPVLSTTKPSEHADSSIVIAAIEVNARELIRLRNLIKNLAGAYIIWCIVWYVGKAFIQFQADEMNRAIGY